MERLKSYVCKLNAESVSCISNSNISKHTFEYIRAEHAEHIFTLIQLCLWHQWNY